MIRSLLGRMLHGLARLLRGLHLYWLARALANRLPPALRLRLSRLQVRTGYMQGLTLVPEDELKRTLAQALTLLGRTSPDAPAIYLEFGVYVGTSLACMHHAATQAGATSTRIIGFDSFQGMPEGSEREDGSRMRKGELLSDVALTRQNLARLGVPADRVELVPGWFKDSLTEETRARLGISTADIVMVDCVIESATREALDFLLPLITGRTIVFFDDWAIFDNDARGYGEKAAFEAWIAAHPEIHAEPRPDLSYSDDERTFLLTRSGASEGAASAGTVAAAGEAAAGVSPA